MSKRAISLRLALLATAVTLLAAMPALAAGDEAGTVRIVRDGVRLEKVRSSETARHALRMAEELRQLVTARAQGLPLPELTTDRQQVQTKNGFQSLRVGVSQIDFTFLRTDGAEPVAACVNPGSFDVASGQSRPTDPRPES